MNHSIDLEVQPPSRLHTATGIIVLLLGYVALIFLIGWLKQ
jgi:hypothetical protein